MFGSSFKSTKAKTACKLCVSRIKLLRNKRNIQLAAMRKEIAKLLREDKKEYAWIRVEAVYREKQLLAGYEILELYLELVAVRAQLLEKAKLAPNDMRESLTSLMFAAPRVADLPELFEVRKIIAMKFGKDLGVEGQNGQEEPRTWKTQVNKSLRRYLSVDAPEPEDKLTLLSLIAEEQQVEFDLDEFEQEMMITQNDPKVAKMSQFSEFGLEQKKVLEPQASIPLNQPYDMHPDGPPPAGFAVPPNLYGVIPGGAPAHRGPPEEWGRAFEHRGAPVMVPKDDGEELLPYGETFPEGAVILPPSNPTYSVGHYGPSNGPYTAAQEAANVAMKAAQDAQKAAEAAQMFANHQSAPVGGPVLGESPLPEDVHPVPQHPQYPPPHFRMKTEKELEEQYNAAQGPPEKAPSAPSVHDSGLPDVPAVPPKGDPFDDMPGIGGLPGSMDEPESGGELQDLNRRFQELKKQNH